MTPTINLKFKTRVDNTNSQYKENDDNGTNNGANSTTLDRRQHITHEKQQQQQQHNKTMKKQQRHFVCSRVVLLLFHLSSIGSSAFLIHVVKNDFTTESFRHQLLALDKGTTARGRQSVLGASSSSFPENDKQKTRYNGRQSQRRPLHRDDDNDNNDSTKFSSSYLATCIPGISAALARELMELGCNNVEIMGESAVRFTANPTTTALSVLLWARTPHKIMELLFTQQGDDDDENVIYNRNDLYNCIRNNVNVKDLLGNGHGGLLSLSVNVMLNIPNNIPRDINHSHFTALTIKNALVDAVRDLRKGEMLDERPNVDLEDPDVPLVAVLRGMTSSSGSSTRNQNGGSMSRGGGGESNGEGGAQLSLYRQLHNGSLHRRGYRQEGTAIHKAAMKESLAAGLLLESEWDIICKDWKQQQQSESDQGLLQQCRQRRLVLVDPMAGSGTLVLEGAIMAADIAPHLMRIKCGLSPGGKSQTYPPMVRWKHNVGGAGAGKDQGENKVNLVMEEWKRLLQDATVRAKTGLTWLKTETSLSNIELIANDSHPGALKLLESALQQAGLNDGIVKVSQLDCRDFCPFSTHTSSSSSGSSDSSSKKNDESALTDVKVMVVTNPPWGARLGGTKDDRNDSDSNNINDNEDDVEDETLHDSWEALRVFLREACPPGKTEAWVLSGNKKSTKHLGLRRSKSIPIKVGQHDLRWIQYEIHDQQTKMAIMATKQQQQQQQQQSQRQNKDTQRSRSLVAYSQKDMNPGSRIRQQSWKEEQQEEFFEQRHQERTASTSTMSSPPPQNPLAQPKRQVVQSRQKAVSDENEWLLD